MAWPVGSYFSFSLFEKKTQIVLMPWAYRVAQSQISASVQVRLGILTPEQAWPG